MKITFVMSRGLHNRMKYLAALKDGNRGAQSTNERNKTT